MGHRGLPLEPGLGAGLIGERLVAGPSPMGSGRAQLEEATWVALAMGSPPLEPVSSRGVGLSSTPELPVVRGVEQVWA